MIQLIRLTIFVRVDAVYSSTIMLTHWGRVTHICVGNLDMISSDNGLLPRQRQAIMWTNAGILLNWPIATNFNEILIEIHTFSFKKIFWKIAAILSRPQCVKIRVFSRHFSCTMSTTYLYQIQAMLEIKWNKLKKKSVLFSFLCFLVAIAVTAILILFHPCEVTSIDLKSCWVFH